MSSSTSKKSHTSKSRQYFSSKTKHSAQEYEDSDNAVDDVAASSRHHSSSKVVQGAVLTTPRPRPVSKSVKVVLQSEDVLELTTSEGGEDAVSSDTLESGSEVADSDDDAVVVEDNTAKIMRTRASNGISKKRYLKDAAIFSDDDEFPRTISPKKSRLNNNALESQKQDDDYDQLSDTGFAVLDDSLTLSPLKLDLSQHRRQNVESIIDPFIAEPVLQKAIVLKSSKSSGKKKVTSLPVEVTSTPDDSELHPEEVASLARAIAVSKRELIRSSRNPSGSSGSDLAIHNNDNTSDVNATLAVSAKVKVAETIATAVSSGNPAIASSGTSMRRTFKDMFPNPKTTPIMSNSPLYHEDLMKYRVRELPKVCGVTDPSIQDKFLAADYESLPPLIAGALRSWYSNKAGMSLVAFSQWASQCPNMLFDVALSAVRFVRYKNYINPSRVSPLDVNIFYTTHDRKRSLLQCNMRTAICLSPVLSRDSFLINATSYGLKNKYISGHFHSQEWQRFEGFVTMVFDKPHMVAQIYNDALSFATMGLGKSDRDSSSPTKAPRHAAILSSSSRRSGSSEQAPKKLIANTSFKTVLDSTDDVPIYDAREHPFNFASDLEDVASILPRIHEEIPPHSFVVIAYTLAHYEKEGSANLSTNVLFAILVGTEYA